MIGGDPAGHDPRPIAGQMPPVGEMSGGTKKNSIPKNVKTITITIQTAQRKDFFDKD